MANKRMFSLDIVDSDAFLDMPSSSQNLYYHLGMRSDDDGFVNPKKVMRLIGASDDDLKVLLSKRFLLNFKSGVVVIKHWLNQNLIRSDLYKETHYKIEKSALGLNDNGSYTELRDGVNEIGNIEPPEWLKRRRKERRYANGTPTALRIGKDRLGKVREGGGNSSVKYLENISEEELASISTQYSIPSDFIKVKSEELFLYCQSKGKKYKNYRAFLINAVKRDYQPTFQKKGIVGKLNKN